MVLLGFYFALAIGVSFLCSILEAVLLSVTPSYVASVTKEPVRNGRLLAGLKRDVERPLAAILSLNTIAHTVGAAGVGAQAQLVYESLPVSVISAVLTLLILVLSVMIVKTVGATYWRVLALPAARVIQVITVGLWPLVKLSEGISGMLSRGQDGRGTVSREEIFAMADVGRAEGLLDPEDADAFDAIARFSLVRVKDVLTPRKVVFALPAAVTAAEVARREEGVPFSRIPVYGETPDDIKGVALKDEILVAAAGEKPDTPVGELARPALVVPEAATARRLFRRFLRQREHLAIVVDEYGGVAGIVTLEDIIETLIGREIMDESDKVEDMRSLAGRAPAAARKRGGES